MDHSATIGITEDNNRLNFFKRIVIAFLLLIGFSVVAYFVFEHEILKSLIPHLPNDRFKTVPYYHDLFRLVVYELISIALILLLALYFYSNASRLSGFIRLETLMQIRQKYFIRCVLIGFAVIVLFNTFLVLQQFPNSSDEYVYLYQAETLSRGELWENAHPIEKAFNFNHIAVKDGIAVGRFPIGWPLILSVFVAIGIPAALVNPILALFTLYVFFRLANRLYGGRVAGWSVLILATSAFFLFNSSSFFSHTSCLLETLLFVYCIYLYLDNKEIKYALLAGVALGLIMLIRYYTAMLLFLPFFILLWYQHGFKIFRLFVLIGIGALPCLLFFFWYNYAITGNPLTPVTVWGYQSEGLGFINGHSFLNGVEHVARRFMMFSYWCTPVMLVMYFILLWQKLKNKQERFIIAEDYFFISFIIGYFFYYEIGGNQYGPRFYFETFPFLILFVVSKVFRHDHHAAKVFLFAALIVMVLKLPLIAYREHAIIDERQNVYDLVEKKGIRNAVVLVASGTSVMRPMPIGDLTRNDHAYKNDVLYAISDERYNAALMKYYKDKNFYTYLRKPERPDGILIKIR